MQKRQMLKRIFLAVFLGMSAGVHGAGSEPLDPVIRQAEKRIDQNALAQQKIDQLDEAIRKNLQTYRQLSKEVEGLEIYKTQLTRQIASQKQEMENIRRSIDQVTVIERQITPLMLKMLIGLEKFVSLDMPFEQEKRLAQVAALKELLDRADVTVAEKYRKVLEAYQQELEYGKTIDAKRGELELEGGHRQVDFLRVGRLAYLYATLDGNEVGFWNRQTARWEPLDGSYRSSMVQALRIAREQAAPDLIRVPLPAATAEE